MDNREILKTLDDLEPQVERLKALYQQYFMGIEKIPPVVLRKNVDRTIWRLRRTKLQNTRLRFKFQQIIQRYNTYQQYWARIMRDIERGTHKRDVVRAAKRFGKDDALREVGHAARNALRQQLGVEEEEANGDTAWELDPHETSWEDDLDDAEPSPDRAAAGPPVWELPEEVEVDVDALEELEEEAAQPPAGPSSPGTASGGPRPRGGALFGRRAAGPRRPLPPPPKRSDASEQGPRRPSPPKAPTERENGPGRPPAKPPGDGSPGRPPPPRATGDGSPGRPPPPRATGARGGDPEGPPPNAPGDRPPGRPPAPPGDRERGRPGGRPPPPHRREGDGGERRPPPPRRSAADGQAQPERSRAIYDEFLRARRASGESSQVSYDKLQESLQKQTEQLRRKHGNRDIDYEVVTKNGRAMIRPIIK